MVFAEGNADAAQQEQIMNQSAEAAEAVLQDGTAVIPADADLNQVKEILGKALVENADQVDLSSLEWEYYCEGKTVIGTSGNASWGSIEGFTSETGKYIKTKYTHPSLAANTDGKYQVRLKGTTTEVTLNKVQKLTSAISTKDNTNVNLVYNEDGSINYDAVRQNIFDTVVESTTPELTVSDVTIEYYATAPGSVGSLGKAWMPLEGGKESIYTYPAMGEGSQKIKISYAGTDTYSGASAEATVNIGIGKEESEIALKADQSVALVYNDDLTIDYAAVKEAIMDQVVDTENSRPEGLSLDNLTIEYYATAETGAVGSIGKAWAPIEGGKINALTYPGIPEGTQKIRVSYAGDKANTAASAETEITVTGRAQSVIAFKENPTIKLVYNDDLTVDYAAAKEAIMNDVIDAENSSPEGLSLDNLTIEYYATATTGQ